MDETEDERRRREELIAGLSTIEAFRYPDRNRAPREESRLAILDTVAPPVGKPTAAPHLRVIDGGKL